ncbi:MAG: saccharopine dehydrogenase NADP-binding domain-containing protein [Caldilineaceae bacterium]|nr:saccharopine dehydrogenase NADP-binding domain-containing protein [Caldilineaceae bacterium]
MHPQFLIYGANGYTGELTARLAVERGMALILAGRNAAEITALGTELGLETRIAGLDDPAALDAMLSGVAVVLHCAGPFVHTSKPMVDACLRAGVHYLDITGEIAVFEALAARYDEARRAGVMLLPGAGFDVVPSDCLAAHLARRLPSATRLKLGIRALSKISRGTAMTGIEALVQGDSGLVRKQGVLTPVPVAWKERAIDFGNGPRTAICMPWGDVATAYHSTGIPDIEVYMTFPPAMVNALKAGRYLGWLFKLPGVAGFARSRIRAGAPGPTPEERAQGRSYLWGRVEDDAGNSAEARLQTPEGYTLTAEASLLIVEKVLAGQATPGYHTPSSAFGADLVMELPGVTRSD